MTTTATGGLLRLRADAYYMPVRDGVWVRTTAGSFTLRGANAATWVQHLAPLLDQGVRPDELYASLRPEQVDYVRTLVSALEARKVLRWEPGTEDAVLAAAFPQQFEFLRHFCADAQAALQRVRSCPVAVAGHGARATVLAAALAECGFADIALRDTEPDAELAELSADYGGRGVPVRLRHLAADDRPVLAAFGPEETEQAFALADRATAAGHGAWLALVRGQAMVLKGQLPGSGTACVRCAWRRLVHSSVGLAPVPGLGHTQVAVAAAVLVQELFQHVALGEVTRLAEGVVVDLPRLSIWRTAVDPDPTCPARDVHGDGAPPAVRPPGAYPDAVFAARCFGPLVGSSPERYRQVPLAVVRLRVNPPGRAEPVAEGTGSLVVAETVDGARAEAALLAVRETLPGAGVREVGRSAGEAFGRALLRYADQRGDGHADAHADGLDGGWTSVVHGGGEARERLAGLAGELPEVVVWRHTSGLYRATAGDRLFAGLDAGQAEYRALLHAVGRAQLRDATARPALRASDPATDPATDPLFDEAMLGELAARLGLRAIPVPVPPLVAAHLHGVSL